MGVVPYLHIHRISIFKCKHKSGLVLLTSVSVSDHLHFELALSLFQIVLWWSQTVLVGVFSFWLCVQHHRVVCSLFVFCSFQTLPSLFGNKIKHLVWGMSGWALQATLSQSKGGSMESKMIYSRLGCCWNFFSHSSEPVVTQVTQGSQGLTFSFRTSISVFGECIAEVVFVRSHEAGSTWGGYRRRTFMYFDKVSHLASFRRLTSENLQVIEPR